LSFPRQKVSTPGHLDTRTCKPNSHSPNVPPALNVGEHSSGLTRLVAWRFDGLHRLFLLRLAAGVAPLVLARRWFVALTSRVAVVAGWALTSLLGHVRFLHSL
jgi:hypothetical protein